MTDYQKALQIVTAGIDAVIPLPTNLTGFRKYLYTLAEQHKKKFATRKQGKDLIIKSINYYQI